MPTETIARPTRGSRRNAEVTTCSGCGELIVKLGNQQWRHIELGPEGCNVGIINEEQAAKAAGLTQNTFRVYRSRGTAPKPDGHLGRTPYWWRTTIEHWRSNGR